MLDINIIRKNPQVVRRDLERRKAFETIPLLDEVIKLDNEWRKLTFEVNKLKHRRNIVSKEISKLKKTGQDVSEKIKEIKEIPEIISKHDTEIKEKDRRIEQILMRLPNILHESVPYGESEEDNVTIRKWGRPREFDFKAKDHIEIAEKLDLFDIERAAKAAGSRFYYLMGELARMNYALINFGLDFIQKKGFTIFQPPYMLREKAERAATDLDDFIDVIYKVEDEDLYLIPTSEHALLAYHMDEILDEKNLPLLYAGVSTCFRKEAGAHGRDTKGIFRVHQFEKLEQFVYSKPEESFEWHEKLLANAEEIYRKLRIPYRVVNICTGDIGTVAAKKYDIEAWLPVQGKYREVVSCSNCTDYQARRAKIRFRDKPDKSTKYMHTLNSTLIATERTLVAIMENYQLEDGSIEVPEVLRKYMDGLEIIGKKD